MKFTVDKDLFNEKLKPIASIINNKNVIPAYGTVKIDATDQHIDLTGMNDDMGIKKEIHIGEKVPLTIDGTGSIALKARLFKSIIKEMPKGDITITTDSDDTKATIKGSHAKFSINGLNADEYPKWPKFDSKQTFNIDSSVLKSIIKETAFCVSDNNSRPTLTGVNLVAKDGVLHATATDSHRLAAYTQSIGSNSDFHMLIPSKSLTKLGQDLGKDQTVATSLSDSQALFTFKGSQFYSRLIMGNYPQTSQLMPKQFALKTEFDSEALAEAVDRSAVVAHLGRNNVIQMDIDPSKSDLEIVSDSPDVGKTTDHIKLKSVSDGREPSSDDDKGKGSVFTITMNPDYISDALKAIGKGTIDINFNSPVSPFIIKDSADTKNTYVQLLTPVRTF